ncbi:MAG: hypothetical protein JNM77_03290, partial [Pseudonocardia sp.]|nr:hypothetical protein [Pseudonocardia sp.]
SPSFLPRPRLTRELDRATPGQVVVVCAPAGFGKTQLLAGWPAGRAGAWVTLDADDDTDDLFWAGLLAALDGVPGADGTLSALPRPARPSRDPAFVASVVDAVAAAGPITLVLDDVHTVSAPEPLHGLAALLRYRPPNLLLVLATRSDATLRLDRLRLGGEVVGLRAGDLAFTGDETSALLTASGVPVSPDRLDLLCAQTEGWAAAVAFAARALAGSADPDVLLRDLAGHPHLADYLTCEILAPLPADIADVLTAVSVCDEVTAPLAAVLAERADAGDVLAELERTTALVTGSGAARGAFGVHPLLRAQLRADLRRRRPDRFAALHGRVARARLDHGDVVGALHHAALADDAVLLGELLDVHGPELATGGHHAVVLTALDALPAVDVSARPRLLLVAALAHGEIGGRAVAHRLLARADAVWPADPAPGLAALRARAVWLGRRDPPGGDLPGARGEPGAGTAVVDLLSRVEHALAAGCWDEAESLTRAAGAEAARQGNTYLEARAVVTLGVVGSLRGDVAGSVALARHAARIAPADRWRGTVGDAYACFLQGYGALLGFRPEECLRWAASVERVTAVASAPPEPAGVVSMVGVLRAAARFDLGEHRAGLAALTAARAEVDAGHLLGRPMLAFAAALEHGAAATLGMRAHARTVAEWTHARLGGTGDVLLMQAWGPASIGRDAAARERLRPVLDGSVPCAVPGNRTEAELLDGALALRAGNAAHARRAVARAVADAATTGVLRPLVTAPPDIGALLGEPVHSAERAELLREVRALRAARDRTLPGTPLTDRERDVLALLPTVLSLEEIADTLAVSLNTVRSHVRSLHGKLGVGSRAEAVRAATRSGLLDVR